MLKDTNLKVGDKIRVLDSFNTEIIDIENKCNELLYYYLDEDNKRWHSTIEDIELITPSSNSYASDEIHKAWMGFLRELESKGLLNKRKKNIRKKEKRKKEERRKKERKKKK